MFRHCKELLMLLQLGEEKLHVYLCSITLPPCGQGVHTRRNSTMFIVLKQKKNVAKMFTFVSFYLIVSCWYVFIKHNIPCIYFLVLIIRSRSWGGGSSFCREVQSRLLSLSCHLIKKSAFKCDPDIVTATSTFLPCSTLKYIIVQVKVLTLEAMTIH